MESKKTIKSLLILAGLFFTIQSYAQTGKIAGKVTDAKSGETLIGLTVKTEGGTVRATSTDVEGRYNLSALAPGKYTVVYNYIGFKTKSISDIEVKANLVTTLDIVMEESSAQQLTEITVTSTVRQESISGLYAQQKTSVSMSSGIVADQIRRSPDRNTSEVLKRVSGTSIQDGKFLIVRGLSDRYNVAMINNSIMPSSEPDRRAFSFDVVPSNLIDKIIVSKTASPDLPGDFAGGVTQIITKDVPDSKFLNFSAAYGYNSQSTFKDFRSSERNSLDFLGFDNGTRSIPSSFPSSRQRYVTLGLNDKIAQSKKFDNLYPEKGSKALPIQSYQLNWGNNKSFKNDGVLGTVVSLTYRNSQNFLDAARETFDGVNFAYRYNDDTYKYNTTVGALANFTYKKNKSKISFKNIFNQSFEDTYVARSGFNQNQSSDIMYNSSELNQKSLISSQLEGDHVFGKKNIKFNWNLNYALVKRDQPDLRSIIYNRPIGSTSPFGLIDDFTRRFFSDLTENSLGGSTSVTIPFDFMKNKSSFKAGLLKQMRIRDFNARVFLYEPANTSQFDNSKLNLSKDVIFDKANISNVGFILNEITNVNDSYDGEGDLNAGFLMLDNKLGKNFRLVWGSRVESYTQTIDTRNASGRVSYDQNFLDILPSFNLTYNLSEKTNFRLSGSRTVSRPELRELAPFTFINQEENSQITGNPNLKRSQNTNADLRFETYPTSGEAFTATLFYKNFNDPIEQVIASNVDLNALRFSYLNARSAFSYGVEIDVRKKLGFLATGSTWAESFVAYGNFTYIKSEVNLGVAGQQKRALQGQSPYLINAGLQFNSPKSGFSVNALYNKIGPRIWRVGNIASGFPDIYERGRDVVDLQLSKRIMKNRAELKLNIGDILNQSQAFYQNFDGNKTFNNTDVQFYNYTAGTNFSLGITYDFLK